MCRVKNETVITSPGFLDWVARLNSSAPVENGKTEEAGVEEMSLVGDILSLSLNSVCPELNSRAWKTI